LGFGQVGRTVDLGLPPYNGRTISDLAVTDCGRLPLACGPLINSITEELGSHRHLAPRVTGIDHPAVSSARWVRVSPEMEGGE
jgi:hypothetical protein